MQFPVLELFLNIVAFQHVLASPAPQPSGEALHPSYRNAFHIFNAIHSSMRQWGSSLNHNGMSFFTASVPAGTELYHGRGSAEPIKGMEWLAFEPEHAQQFAHRMFRRPPGKGPGGEPGKGRSPPPPSHADGVHARPKWPGQKPMTAEDLDGPPPPWETLDDEEPQEGFLHTFTAKRDLNLLYIDGMSAGKTNNGTLDSQDYVLLQDADLSGGMFGEFERARGMCNISRDDWGGRVDGFLRMEAGFEIILCHFERDLNVKSVNRAYGKCKDCNEDFGGNIKYLRAVSDRYHGIGGGRVNINYEKMVTAYALHEDLFQSGESGPRLTSVSKDDKKRLREQVDAIVMAEPSSFKHTGQDWQAIADMIVTRYSSRLKLLAMPEVLENEQRLNTELDLLLSPSIDYDNRDAMNETSRCASHYIPKGSLSSLAAHNVAFVSSYICHKLVSTQFGDVADSHEAKKKIILDLIEKLNWTTWKECNTCAYDEICSIPIWPFGSEQDWITPTCRNATTIHEQHGYWGIGGPGGGRRPPPKDDKKPPAWWSFMSW